jgi:hypothetical protein
MAESERGNTAPVKAGNVLGALLVSPEMRWFYRTLLGLFLVTGTAFALVGARRLYIYFISFGDAPDDYLSSGLTTTTLGLVILTLALGLHQLRRYVRASDIVSTGAIRLELSKLDEDDFEAYDRVRRLREQKAQEDFEANLGANLVVTRLECQNARMFGQMVWNLQPGVNVLLGRNGYGKSLALRALVGLLQRDEESTESLFQPTDAAVSKLMLHVRRNQEDLLVERSALRFVKSVGKVPVLAIPDSRFFDRSQAVVGPDDTETSDLKTYGAYHFLHQKPYGSVVQGLLYEICLDYWEHGRDFDRPVFHFLRECVRRLTNYEFRFASIERRGRTGFEIRVVTEGNNDPLPIQYASQGTLSVLSMFGLMRSYLRAASQTSDDDLVFRGPGIIVIDEADAHLHPTWQQKFPTLLKDLFPNVQFIVSAHSPLFVAGCWKDEVAVLRKATPDSGGVGFTIEQIERDFVGASAGEIYDRVFDVEELDDTFLEYATKATLRSEHSGRINELTSLSEKNALSPAEMNELRMLQEESRRIRRVSEIKEQRRQAGDEGLRIAELESEVMKLQSRLGSARESVS